MRKTVVEIIPKRFRGMKIILFEIDEDKKTWMWV